jgi:glycosyltransferase involved in cell wall biosynthesis
MNKMERPLVSVVIPVYNGQPYLRQAIESALGQTYAPLEVIAVNDGSTDGSAGEIACYGDRVVALHQANAGVGAARNAGAQRASGRFIAFLDQDDWWEPEKVAAQVARFEAEPEVGLVHTNVKHYSEASATFVGPLNPLARPETLVGDCYPLLLAGNAIYNSSVMVRTSVLRRVGVCDPRIVGNSIQDYDLWLRLARVSRLAFLAEPLTVIRMHNTQGTWDRRRMLGEESKLCERILAEDRSLATSGMRRRMARLYEELGTAHLDFGELALARRNYGRSFRWSPTRRAAIRFAACFLPLSAIRRLQAARVDRRRQAMLGPPNRS